MTTNSAFAGNFGKHILFPVCTHLLLSLLSGTRFAAKLFHWTVVPVVVLEIIISDYYTNHQQKFISNHLHRNYFEINDYYLLKNRNSLFISYQLKHSTRLNPPLFLRDVSLALYSIIVAIIIITTSRRIRCTFQY